VAGFRIDTNVLSESARPKPSRRVVAFLHNLSLDQLYLCDVIIAEIRFGLETAADSARRLRFSNWLHNFVRPNFAGRILALTEDVFLQWRVMKEAGRKRGHTFPEPDLLIAATAFHYGLTVVTRDIEPFQQANMPGINPWAGVHLPALIVAFAAPLRASFLIASIDLKRPGPLAIPSCQRSRGSSVLISGMARLRFQ
jgi:predicted nucleic acid-binding protein